MFINTPEKFAAWFNEKYPGAYRPITTKDANDMTVCGLIGRYGFYLRDDLKTAEGMLEYEQLRAKRDTQQTTEVNQEPAKCKMCGQPLPREPEDKGGRPKEYCPICSPLRDRERQKKLRQQRRQHHRPESHN